MLVSSRNPKNDSIFATCLVSTGIYILEWTPFPTVHGTLHTINSSWVLGARECRSFFDSQKLRPNNLDAALKHWDVLWIISFLNYRIRLDFRLDFGVQTYNIPPGASHHQKKHQWLATIQGTYHSKCRVLQAGPLDRPASAYPVHLQWLKHHLKKY